MPEEAVRLVPRQALEALKDEWGGMRCRFIVPPKDGGWSDFAFSEWELEAGTWSDLHHHDELNFILKGELEVESEGITRVAGPGDTVVVKAGCRGTYTARGFVHMVAIYGPNPGVPDGEYQYRDLTD